MRSPPNTRRTGAFSLVELLVVLAILGILLTIVALNLRDLANPLEDASRQLNSTLTQARLRAIETTSAVRVVRASGTSFTTSRAPSCASPTASWTNEAAVGLTLVEGVQVSNVTPNNQNLCFNSRGLASQPFTYELRDRRGRTSTVQVYLGGAIQRSGL